MVSERDLKMEDKIRSLTSNLLGNVVFAGHHEFSALLPDLLEDAVVTSLNQFVGLPALFRCKTPPVNDAI